MPTMRYTLRTEVEEIDVELEFTLRGKEIDAIYAFEGNRNIPLDPLQWADAEQWIIDNFNFTDYFAERRDG